MAERFAESCVFRGASRSPRPVRCSVKNKTFLVKEVEDDAASLSWRKRTGSVVTPTGPKSCLFLDFSGPPFLHVRNGGDGPSTSPSCFEGHTGR